MGWHCWLLSHLFHLYASSFMGIICCFHTKERGKSKRSERNSKVDKTWQFFTISIDLFQKFQLACQDTDDWGPREGIIRTDWRRSHMEHKNFKSNSVILKNANCNSTYEREENVYENIRFRPRDSKICVDNPAFIPDENEKWFRHSYNYYLILESHFWQSIYFTSFFHFL